jgi:transposase
MPSKLDALKPVIDQWLAATPRLQATRIHQDLVRDYGFEGGYNTVRRYVERSRPRPEPRSEVRFETAPGFQAQVDWSHEQPITTSSGLELPLYCFHMVLGHSRDSFCALTGSQDLVTFWACHRGCPTFCVAGRGDWVHGQSGSRSSKWILRPRSAPVQL